MTSKNSSYKTLVRRNLSSRLWAVVLTFLGSLSTLLLPVFVVNQNFQRQMEEYAHLIEAGRKPTSKEEILRGAQDTALQILSMDNPFIKIVVVFLAILCGVAMFRYLHDRQQVDFYHALPMNRGRLFVLNYVSGILLVLPVFLLVFVLTTIVAMSMGLGGLLTAGGWIQTFLAHTVFFLLNYTLAVVCTVVTGNTIITILLGIWAEVSIPLFALMIDAWKISYLQTYVEHTNGLYFMSPIIKYFATSAEKQGMTFFGTPFDSGSGMHGLIAPAIWTIVLLALAYVLFVRRKSERAGTAIAFTPLKAPIRWYMCLFMGSACAWMFTELFYGNEYWRWFGLFLGIVLFHAVVEIIYDFDFKAMFHHWKQMIAVCIVAAAALAGLRMDVFGYNRYIPKETDIAAVGLWNMADRSRYGFSWNEPETRGIIPLTDPENIHLVTQIAERLVPQVGQELFSVDSESERENNPYTDVYIHYELKNGKQVSRKYVTGEKLIRDLLDPLMQSEAYIKSYMALQQAQIPENTGDGDIRLQVTAQMVPMGLGANYVIEKTADIERVLEALKKEQIQNAAKHRQEIPVMQMRFLGSAKEDYTPVAEEMESFLETRLDSMQVYPSDTQTLALLKQLVGLEPQSLDVTRVEYIEIREFSSKLYAESDSDAEKLITIRDPETITALVQDLCGESQIYSAGKDVAWEEFGGQTHLEFRVWYRDGNRGTTGISARYPEGKAPIELLREITGLPLGTK